MWIQSLENRTFFSALSDTSGVTLKFANQQYSFSADPLPAHRPVVLQVVNSVGDPVKLPGPHKVTLSIANGANAGQVVATAKLVGSTARIHSISLHEVGTFSITASVSGLALKGASTFTITPGRGYRMSVDGFASTVPDSGIAEFTATIFDRFGNIATQDHSAISLWKNRDKFTYIYPLSSAPIYNGKGDRTGVRFDAGVASFEVIAVLGPRTVSVTFSDSNPRVRRIHSIPWQAKA